MASSELAAPPPPRTLPLASGLQMKVVLAFLPFLPLLYWQVVQLWSRPHYRFFPFVLLGGVALLAKYLRRAGHVEPGSRVATAALFALAGVLVLAAGIV